MTNREKVTFISWNNAEKKASIYTSDPGLIKKLDGYVRDYPDDYQMVKTVDAGKMYMTNSDRVRILCPTSSARRTASKKAADVMNARKHADGS